MRGGGWGRAAAAVLALIVGAAAQAEPIPSLPPYTGAYQPQGVDERGLWMEFDELERSFRDSTVVINDAPLKAYIQQVVCRMVGAARCQTVRLYIVRDTSFNASMAPNGMMIVHTGLLLRARDEAELAAVLGHEFSHFELRHSLLGFRHNRIAGDIVAWAGVAAAGAVAYGGSSAYDTVRTAQSVQNAAIGSTFAHSRDQERQADLLSMAYLKASPYDPRSFPDIWDRLMDEADATAHGRRQRSTRYDRVGFFADHPSDLERARTLRALAVAIDRPGEDGKARYDTAVARWRAQWLADQIKRNDFEGTDYLLGQLAGSEWSPDLLFARGELYRTRGNPRDLVAAVGFYREVVTHDPTNAEAYRGLGLAQLRSHDAAGAAALKTYLTMKPAADDAAMISMLIQ
ncbi:M48 family metallopeptidase [Sphingomonas sp. PAMC 26621]|uniref:M48 family metallopeptidase n=1 Tax=Sphingomonas sp. PAMC 26621 TaxID=1112213 RepID=UPI000288093B|nr:M48 family metallopeptidase [Sphingomonas sp. PAMC 26621]